MSEGPGTLERQLDLACDLRNVGRGVEFVREVALEAGVAEQVLGPLSIAAEEAISNAIDHGSACNTEMNVEIRCLMRERVLWLVVRDHGGKPFNPDYFLNIATKKIWGKGGRGILMITRIMDSVSYVFRAGHTTILTLSLRLDDPGPEPD